MLILIEYVVFFFLFAIALLVFVLHSNSLKHTPKERDHNFDYERYKLESYIERRLYDVLVARGEIVKAQVLCGKYRIDLTLPAYKIAIECDGKAFHSTPKQKAHDQRKNRYLRKHGWKVLRFTGKAINGNIKAVITRIEKVKR